MLMPCTFLGGERGGVGDHLAVDSMCTSFSCHLAIDAIFFFFVVLLFSFFISLFNYLLVLSLVCCCHLFLSFWLPLVCCQHLSDFLFVFDLVSCKLLLHLRLSHLHLSLYPLPLFTICPPPPSRAYFVLEPSCGSCG